jgi:hypothetical protein
MVTTVTWGMGLGLTPSAIYEFGGQGERVTAQDSGAPIAWPHQNVGPPAYRTGMNDHHRYDVTVTITKGGGNRPDPAEFAVAAEQAASSRAAAVMSAHTAEKIISIVTVEAADQPSAVAIGLAVVSEALRVSTA